MLTTRTDVDRILTLLYYNHKNQWSGDQIPLARGTILREFGDRADNTSHLIDQLDKEGLIKHVGGNCYDLTDKGIEFYENEK